MYWSFIVRSICQTTTIFRKEYVGRCYRLRTRSFCRWIYFRVQIKNRLFDWRDFITRHINAPASSHRILFSLYHFAAFFGILLVKPVKKKTATTETRLISNDINMISPQSFQDGDKNYMNGHRLTHFMVSLANVWRRVATQSQFTDIWFHHV